MRKVALLTAASAMSLTLGVGAIGNTAWAANGAHIATVVSASKAIPVSRAIPATKGPKVVKIKGSGPVFKPKSVTGPVVSDTDCSDTDFSFAVANLSKATQQLEYTPGQGGTDFGPPIPSGDELGICVDAAGNYGKSLTLVSNSKTTLKIKIT